MDEKKPNILYIFSDQHRKFDIGCYGHEFVKTPNLDKLAEGGLRFNHCISNSPVCVPARGALLTGLHAGKHKAFTNDMSIDPSCTSIADVLKKAGYYTGYLGKWHLAGIPREQAITKENRLGFEEWKVANCNHNYLDNHYYDENNVKHVVDGYEPEIFGGLALDFIENHKKDENPWALYLSLATPHEPFGPIKQEYLEEYADVEITLRPNTQEYVISNKGEPMDIASYREYTRGYWGHVSAIDKQIGLLIEKLKESNQLENTMIIYSSDHGDMLGSQGTRDKQVPYEESIGIPLIAYWENHIYEGVCDELIGLPDLPVTVAGLVGEKFPVETDGEDLSRLFLDKDAKGYHSAYMYEYYPAHQATLKHLNAWRGIRTKRYTYAVEADNLDWLLFDNVTDPYQLDNLAGREEYDSLQRELWEELKAHIEKHDALVDGVDYVIRSGQIKEFNASQKYFGYDTIEE